MAPLRTSATGAAAAADFHALATCEPSIPRTASKRLATSTSTSTTAITISSNGSCAPPASSDASLRVLVTRELLENITDFMRGVPKLLTDFQTASSRTSSAAKTKCAPRTLSPFTDDPANPADKSTEWSACYDPQAANGAITRMALTQDNRRVLAMLLRLHQFPVYRRMRKLRLDMIVTWGVELGHLQTLEWLKPRTPNWDALMTRASKSASLLDTAIRNGDVEMMEWVRQNCAPESCRVTPEAIALAPTDRVADVVQWLHANDFASSLTHENVTGFAARGCLQALVFVHNALPADQSERLFSTATLDAAAGAGHLDVVAFLHSQRHEGCTTGAMDEAARQGHIDLVRFLHSNRTEGCTRSAMDGAAANGHLAVVKFLHTRRREGCTVAAVNDAACNGHSAIVRFLLAYRREGCTFAAMEQAALNGHADIVQYLHRWRSGQERVFCTPQAMDNAAGAGHLEIVRFLHKNRREGCTTKAMDLAAHNGYLEIVKFLHEHRSEGCTRAAMNLAASAGHLDIVRFLHTNRSEGCTKRALSMAARNGFTPVVKFLVENRSEGCAEDALRCAYRSGRFEVVRYLHARGFMGNVAKCVVSCCCAVVIQYS